MYPFYRKVFIIFLERLVMPKDKEKDLNELFEQFAKLVDKERKRRIKKELEKKESQKKEDRFIKHERS